MKKILFFIPIVFLFTSSWAQFSKQDAIDLVIDSIASDRIDSVNIYVELNSLTSEYYIISPYDSIFSPYNNYWLFFIDEQPQYLWGHLCSYVLINSITGVYTLISYNLPPVGFQINLDTVSVPLLPPTVTHDYTKSYNGTQTEENPHSFAVLFSGNGQVEEPIFWNHLSHMYCALK
jgi:hypothetical protein